MDLRRGMKANHLKPRANESALSFFLITYRHCPIFILTLSEFFSVYVWRLFSPQRPIKTGYAIPYEGEEVKLPWGLCRTNYVRPAILRTIPLKPIVGQCIQICRGQETEQDNIREKPFSNLLQNPFALERRTDHILRI